jgi:hypothetical protein
LHPGADRSSKKVSLPDGGKRRSEMNTLFEVHMLNEKGQGLAKSLAGEFYGFLCSIEGMCGTEGREMAIARTKLEEACFFAKKAMASRKENQQ